MSNQVPPGPGQPPPAGAEPPYGPYSPPVPPPGAYSADGSPGAPPPGYPSGTPQPSAGQPSYEPYGQQPPTAQPSYEPYGQQPPAGQPAYEPYGQQPYGPAPQPGPYGAQPPGASGMPYGAYGSYPTPPKSGSGGKIVAIVAAAVVVVGLVVGGVFLLTRDDDSSAGGPTTTSTSTKKSPRPSATTDTPSPRPTEPEGPTDAELTLAETAFPAVDGYGPFECTDYAYDSFDDLDLALYCHNDNYDMYEVYQWPDVDTALASIRNYGAYGGRAGYYVEGAWSGGTSFVDDRYGYEEIRCYADVPLCLEVSYANNAQQAEDQFSRIAFLEATGIEALKALLDGEGV